MKDKKKRKKRKGLTRLRRNVNPILRAPRNMKMIPNLLQLILADPATPNRRIDTSPPLPQSPLHRPRRIRPLPTRHNALHGQELERIQPAEKFNRFAEIIHHFFLRSVHFIEAFGVAAFVKGGDAGTVFTPFVLPKGFVGAVGVFPVRVHVGEQVSGGEGVEDLGDVGVLAGWVAVGLVGAVAVVGPVCFGVRERKEGNDVGTGWIVERSRLDKQRKRTARGKVSIDKMEERNVTFSGRWEGRRGEDTKDRGSSMIWWDLWRDCSPRIGSAGAHRQGC